MASFCQVFSASFHTDLTAPQAHLRCPTDHPRGHALGLLHPHLSRVGLLPSQLYGERGRRSANGDGDAPNAPRAPSESRGIRRSWCGLGCVRGKACRNRIVENELLSSAQKVEKERKGSLCGTCLAKYSSQVNNSRNIKNHTFQLPAFSTAAQAAQAAVPHTLGQWAWWAWCGGARHAKDMPAMKQPHLAAGAFRRSRWPRSSVIGRWSQGGWSVRTGSR